jgi:hypothetical protein
MAQNALPGNSTPLATPVWMLARRVVVSGSLRSVELGEEACAHALCVYDTIIFEQVSSSI